MLQVYRAEIGGRMFHVALPSVMAKALARSALPLSPGWAWKTKTVSSMLSQFLTKTSLGTSPCATFVALADRRYFSSFPIQTPMTPAAQKC